MRSALHDLSMSAARADALFASALQCSDEPSARQVEQAVTAAIGAFGELGCAARVAQAYGEHPETAVTRMRWARVAVADAFDPAPRPEPLRGLAADRPAVSPLFRRVPGHLITPVPGPSRLVVTTTAS